MPVTEDEDDFGAVVIKARSIGRSPGPRKAAVPVIPSLAEWNRYEGPWRTCRAREVRAPDGHPASTSVLVLLPGDSQKIERALQNEHGGVLIDHCGALGAARIGRDQLALDRRGRQPLVPERDRQFGEL